MPWLRSTRWRAFAGVDAPQLFVAVEAVCREGEYEHEARSIPASVMLGGSHPGREWRVHRSSHFTVRVQQASGDPVLRTVHGLLSMGERLERLSFVEITPVRQDTREAIGCFLEAVVGRLPHPPWEVSHHLRFRTSPILRAVNSSRWRTWSAGWPTGSGRAERST